MCLDAVDLYGACVEDWGLSWPDVGHDDERAYLDSCETWVWEARSLSRDSPEWLEQACRERRQAFRADEATCDTYTSIDWSLIGEDP